MIRNSFLELIFSGTNLLIMYQWLTIMEQVTLYLAILIYVCLPTGVSISVKVTCLLSIYHFTEISAIRIQNLLLIIIKL